jgi:hypothetical protein
MSWEWGNVLTARRMQDSEENITRVKAWRHLARAGESGHAWWAIVKKLHPRDPRFLPQVGGPP